jgi:Cu(I)/Ag(I) efflux system membrane fusion protein
VVTEGGLILDGQAQLARAAITGEISQHEHPAAAATSAPVARAETSTVQLKALALAAADAAALLAADDFPGYQKHLPVFRAALDAYLAAELKAGHDSSLDKFKAGLPERPDLRAARRDFEPLSTALADLVRSEHLTEPENLHVFQCPMSPVLGTGRWLARTASVRNPFFGSAMLECGEELP